MGFVVWAITTVVDETTKQQMKKKKETELIQDRKSQEREKESWIPHTLILLVTAYYHCYVVQ